MEEFWKVRRPLFSSHLDYRVAHNVATSHVLRERRVLSRLVSLEEMEGIPDSAEPHAAADQGRDLERLSALIQRLKPLDRQVIVAYLEDMDAISIGEITGLSAGNVAMRISRAKKRFARRRAHSKRRLAVS